MTFVTNEDAKRRAQIRYRSGPSALRCTAVRKRAAMRAPATPESVPYKPNHMSSATDDEHAPPTGPCHAAWQLDDVEGRCAYQQHTMPPLGIPHSVQATAFARHSRAHFLSVAIALFNILFFQLQKLSHAVSK